MSVCYYDIDIKNCHPVLLQQYAKINTLSYKYIKIYNSNRDELSRDIVRNIILIEDNLKKSFLSIVNGGKTFLSMKRK